MKPAGSWIRFRIFLVLGLFLVFFASLLLRAFQIQIVKGKTLERRARSQHEKTIRVESKRGEILDRNMKELAVSVEVDSVYAQPARIKDPHRVASILSPILSIGRQELERRLTSSRPFEWLKRQIELDEEKRRTISGLHGIGIVKEARRYYPNRTLASNLIGFAGIDSRGLEGVELYYDRFLKGTSKKITGEKDARGKIILFEDLEKTVPFQGMDVVLTIDKTIQYITEKALRKAVSTTGAKGGIAIVMSPYTGEILAMAVYPTFDPNDIRRFSPSDWRNRAVTDIFEPGSTFKLFLLASALEENVVRADDIFYCENGSYRVADRVFHDVRRFGWLSLTQIIKYSSNIGAAKVGERLGSRRFYRYLRAFGFGSRTGIDLPGEARGILRHYEEWSGVSINTISFGHGISVTAIQLVTALSAIANGGFLMKPHVVKAIKDADGKTVFEAHPVIVRRVISEDTAKKVRDILVTVTEKGGTGMLASIDGFRVAGKTGTAEKPDLEKGGYKEDAYIASFLGFVPAERPEIAILVTIDEPKEEFSGGVVAAPVFREIASQTLAYMGVFPERTPDGTINLVRLKRPYGPVPEEIYPSRVVPDFRGRTMREVLRMAGKKGLEVVVHGSGRAVSQRPSPGRTTNGQPVVVWFGEM